MRCWFVSAAVWAMVTMMMMTPGSLRAAEDLAPATGALAEERSPGSLLDRQGGIEPQCRAEAQQLCGNVPSGGGRIRDCLKENESKLSAGCHQQLRDQRNGMEQQRNARRRDMREACSADVKRLCGTVEPGSGRIIDCLSEHRKELSSRCAEGMESRRYRK